MNTAQRPIKFRVWDSGELRQPMKCIDLYWFEEYGFREWSNTRNVHEHGVFLMQFTGLQDKNGKDIYEGDIVRLNTGLACEVKHGWWTFQGIGGSSIYGWYVDDGDGWQWSIDCGCEIVGNIYENPELLERAS